MQKGYAGTRGYIIAAEGSSDKRAESVEDGRRGDGHGRVVRAAEDADPFAARRPHAGIGGAEDSDGGHAERGGEMADAGVATKSGIMLARSLIWRKEPI